MDFAFDVASSLEHMPSKTVLSSNRVDRHLHERLWRLLSVCAVSWGCLSVYCFLSGRLLSGYICAGEAAVSLLLVTLTRYTRLPRLAIVHLQLMVAVVGLVAEAVLSGNSHSDTLFFLCCAVSLAVYQLGVRQALSWTVVTLLCIVATNLSFPEMVPIGTNAPFDRMLIQLAVPLVIFGLSYQAERSSLEFAETLCAEKEMAERLAAVTMELQERTRLLSLAEQVSHVGHWRLNLQTKTVSLSNEACRICGFDEAKQEYDVARFLDCFDFVGGEQIRRYLSEASHHQNEFEFHTTLCRGEDIRYVSLCGFNEASATGEITAVFGVLKDETDATVVQEQLREKANELNELAKYDPLTGLANRHSFQDQLERALARSLRTEHEVALLLIDLDGFKEINDTMGHPYGDRVLEEVAERLRGVIRDGDTVARIGGDEFTVIVNHIKNDLDISLVAGRIRRAIGQPFELDDKKVLLGASIGAAVCPRHTQKLDELLAFADTAMYVAKSQGVGVELYSSDMTTEIIDRRAMELNLQQAWDRKEFHLEYQPQVSAAGVATGVEALLRWNNDGRPVSPMEFVPHLEQSGDIVKVGRWVIHEACHQAMRWHDEGIPITVSVNISSVQFSDPDFVDSVWEALDSSGLPGKYLDLELTESVLIQDVQTTANRLTLVKETGATISIDDFGTGYSSLAYLRHLPIDRLKIDRTFVKDIPDGDDGTIASSVIVLARSLGMEVLAEGIETQEQLDFLNAQGCDQYQGYYFSRPLKPDACEEFLRPRLNSSTVPAESAS